MLGRWSNGKVGQPRLWCNYYFYIYYCYYCYYYNQCTIFIISLYYYYYYVIQLLPGSSKKTAIHMKPRRYLAYPRNPQLQCCDRKCRASSTEMAVFFEGRQAQNSVDTIELGDRGGHEEPGMLYYVIFCSAGNQKINLPLEDGFYHPLMVSLGIFFFVGFTALYYITGQSMSIDILSASRQPAIWSFGWTVRLFNKFVRPWTNPTIYRGFITMDGYISQ